MKMNKWDAFNSIGDFACLSDNIIYALAEMLDTLIFSFKQAFVMRLAYILSKKQTKHYCISPKLLGTFEPAHEIMVLITYATSEDSGEPAHPRSLARAFAVRTHKVWKWTKGPTEHQISTHIKYGSGRRVRPNIRYLPPLGGCACAFEEWVYGERKVP